MFGYVVDKDRWQWDYQKESTSARQGKSALFLTIPIVRGLYVLYKLLTPGLFMIIRNKVM